MALVSQEISNNIRHQNTGILRSLKASQPLLFSSFSQCYAAEIKEQQIEGRQKERIRVKRKGVSSFQRLDKFLGITHIYNFMDQMCINEETLRNQNNDESILKTLFYMRSITKIETSPSSVKMWLKSNEPPSNTSYLIQRFNSFGDSYFHNIANTLQKLYGFFISLQGCMGGAKQDCPSGFEVTRQKVVSEFLASVEGKPYFLKILPDQYIFSNELIGLLGGTADDFAHECLKYKVLMEDFFTSDNYQLLLERNLLFIDCYAQFLKGNITMDKVLESSDMRFTFYLRAKNQKRIRVLVRGFMPNPYIFCMIIEAVLSEEPLMPKPKTFTQEQKIEFDKLLAKQKEQIYEKIYYPTRNNFSQKGYLRCGYAPKPKRRRRKSECDYDY